MKFIIALLTQLLVFSAFADQVVNLNQPEVQAANFLAQCSHEIAGKGFLVSSGYKGTFTQGIVFDFRLQSPNCNAILEVRWVKATQTYSCELSKCGR